MSPRARWAAAFTFVPDLTIAIAAIGALALVTGITRLVRLATGGSIRRLRPPLAHERTSR